MLSVLIVSYNTREMTLACLRSVFEETVRTSFELIVVDNQSEDGSADSIKAEFGGRVRLIRAESNLGFAAANNLAAEEARGDHLLLLNPDTVVLDGAIDKLMDFARERPEAKIWGGRTVFEDGSLNVASCWRRMTIWSLLCRALALTRLLERSSVFNPEAYGGWDRSTVRQVDIVSGCFLLIERALWNQLRGFDPAFFMYGEEADLCLRARRRGARPVITPAATIVHHGGASEKVRADKLVRLLKAKALLIRRHMPAWRRPIALALLAVWPLSRSFTSRRNASNPPDHDEGAAAWATAWRRRADWLQT